MAANLPNLVKKLREQRGLTQSDLAVKSGVSGTTIGQIEQGKFATIRPSTAMAVFDALAAIRPLLEPEAAVLLGAAKRIPNKDDGSYPDHIPTEDLLHYMALGLITSPAPVPAAASGSATPPARRIYEATSRLCFLIGEEAVIETIEAITRGTERAIGLAARKKQRTSPEKLPSTSI